MAVQGWFWQTEVSLLVLFRFWVSSNTGTHTQSGTFQLAGIYGILHRVWYERNVVRQNDKGSEIIVLGHNAGGPEKISWDQGLTGRAFRLRVGYGSGIGKNISGWFGYGSGTGIGIIYRANRVLSGIEKLDRVFFGYFFHVTYLLYGMIGKRLSEIYIEV